MNSKHRFCINCKESMMRGHRAGVVHKNLVGIVGDPRLCSIIMQIIRYNEAADRYEYLYVFCGEVLRRGHEKGHHTGICGGCGKTGKVEKQGFVNHIAKHYKIKPWSCRECPKTYKTITARYIHEQVTHNSQNMTIRCKSCKIDIIKLRKKTHEKSRRHKLRKKYKWDGENYTCAKCGITIPQQTKIQNHRCINRSKVMSQS